MRRPDLPELVRHAAGTGLTVALTPSGTAAATPAKLAALKEAGLSRVAVSLDGPTPELHDAFRGVRGSYAWTMRIIEAAIDLELPLQINSTISRRTLEHFEAMAVRVAGFPLTLWALCFLIHTGRGAGLEQINDVECEQLLNRLYDLSLTSPFGIKTTEAPHYQRVVWQREQARLRDGLPSQAVARRRQLRAPRSVSDGNGFVFIGHLGNICPSGFLPVRGNVRTTNRLRYHNDDLHAPQRERPDGRRPLQFRIRWIRSRAFAATGAVMTSVVRVSPVERRTADQTSGHRQQHLEPPGRDDGVWLVRRHQHEIARRHAEGHARDSDEGFSLQHVRDGVERRGVLTERLAFVEREQRHAAAATLEQDATDHRTVLIRHQAQRRNARRAGHFRWIRHAFPRTEN